MLSQPQIDRINKQITIEANVSRLYLQIACWAEAKSLKGVASFFRSHHEIEEEHMHRLMDFLIEAGGSVKMAVLEAPQHDFSSVTEALELAFRIEAENAQNFNSLADYAFSEKDFATFNFLQWYLAEQHEEQQFFRALLEKVKIIGEEGRGLFWIDKELGNNLYVCKNKQ